MCNETVWLILFSGRPHHAPSLSSRKRRGSLHCALCSRLRNVFLITPAAARSVRARRTRASWSSYHPLLSSPGPLAFRGRRAQSRQRSLSSLPLPFLPSFLPSLLPSFPCHPDGSHNCHDLQVVPYTLCVHRYTAHLYVCGHRECLHREYVIMIFFLLKRFFSVCVSCRASQQMRGKMLTGWNHFLKHFLLNDGRRRT